MSLGHWCDAGLVLSGNGIADWSFVSLLPNLKELIVDACELGAIPAPFFNLAGLKRLRLAEAD